MSIGIGICAILSAFVISFLLVPLTARLAFKIGAIDRPNIRKVHAQKMPRLGGLGIFVSFTLVSLIFVETSGPFWGVIIGACIITVVGVLDDIYHLSPLMKLAGQAVAAVVAMSFGVLVHFMTNPFDGLFWLGYLSIPITFLWIVGITNAVNLIDGLDGLAAGVSAIAALTMAIVAMVLGDQLNIVWAALILVGAILGFIPYNFYPARTFMGDGGSNLLGYLLACLAILGSLKSTAVISIFIPIVILGIPIFDTFFAIIRRINRNASILRPDKDHLHHRLMALGISHRTSVIIIYFISGGFGLVACTLTFLTGPKASLLFALLILGIVWGADKIGLFTGSANIKNITLNDNSKAHKAQY